MRRGHSCGSWPSRGGTLPAGGGGVRRVSQNTMPEPFYGLQALPDDADGSAIVFWDTRRTPPPPAGNVPPREGEDPHEMPRRSAAARRQKSAFLRPGGKVVDVCGGGPCVTG